MFLVYALHIRSVFCVPLSLVVAKSAVLMDLPGWRIGNLSEIRKDKTWKGYYVETF